MHLRSLAAVLILGGLAVGVHDARAGTWPPPRGTDMSNPANWPNDPGYAGDWNYWGFLPRQLAGSQPYVASDVKLGASGMHIDQAWTYTTGRPDVRIAVLDCGIDWSRADLANKAHLSAAELSGTHRPQNAQGTQCPAADPTHPELGWDCDGDGVFTVADYRDDPRISPAATSPNCKSGTIAGDVNQNCLLDAGDLITLFSDKVDDDNNGYTDDISGWDFYKDDNNPYDDTRYNHGSGEAEDSSGEGNNGMDDIGTCPDCRFLMLRVGDSFVADGTDFAKAVVYAADNDVKVVQEALGTVSQTAFSKAAIDYAYAHGTTVVASMADENSRHHNMPAVTNHTLPVHAIATDKTMITVKGSEVYTDATTFIAFNACTNYGGQNMLSVSGNSCSSEATGKGSGQVGLILSEGLNKGLQLTPEEVMQLLKMNAEIIDVPESRSPDPNVSGAFYESLPYFSQRFGYGRPRMDKTLEAIDQGKIPPEVDLTSPAWFDVLYADRTTAPVPVVGRVAAARAQSYDYVVEWAPGVEPSDALFQPLTDWVRNVPSTTTSGGASAPLAMLAPKQLNTSHARDPDSAMFGENDRTITVRVRAIAHYASGDVPGQARRTLAVVNDLPAEVDGGSQNGLDRDLAQGFPLAMGASVEPSPKLADIDGDGIRDVVAAASDGRVHVFTMKGGTPAELPGFPFRTDIIDGLNPNVSDPTVPSYLSAPAYMHGGGIDPDIARESIVAAPAIGDVDGDGKDDLVVASWQGKVYVVGHDGQALPGWPQRLRRIPSCTLPQNPGATDLAHPCMDAGHKWARGAGASPVLVDFDGDGKLEIVQAAFDGYVYVWHGDGSPLAGWPVLVHNPKSDEYARIMSTPAVADFNGDGVPDVVTGSNEEVQQNSASFFLIDGRGTNTPGGSPYFKNWPFITTALHVLPMVVEGTDSSPAIADFTRSGHPEILFMSTGAPPKVFPADPGPQGSYVSDPPNRLPVYHTDAGTQVGFDPTAIFGAGTKAAPDTMWPAFGHPAIGDVDGDGVPDPIMAGASLSLLGSQEGGRPGRRGQQLLSMWSGATGHMTWGSPVPIEDYTLLSSEAVADISGDGYPEVLVGTGGYSLRAADACGCEAPSWPKFTGGWIATTPAVGDIDGDHSLEVVAGTRDGYLFAWHTRGTDTGVVQWESFHHDNANTGNYLIKLQQGVLKAAAHPIDCSVDCAAPPPPQNATYSAGGCGCRAAPDGDERAGGPAALLVAGLGAVLARRRRR